MESTRSQLRPNRGNCFVRICEYAEWKSQRCDHWLEKNVVRGDTKAGLNADARNSSPSAYAEDSLVFRTVCCDARSACQGRSRRNRACHNRGHCLDSMPLLRSGMGH
jgi:hypothetical protein